jgi:hypothetical protein
MPYPLLMKMLCHKVWLQLISGGELGWFWYDWSVSYWCVVYFMHRQLFMTLKVVGQT